MNIRHYTAVISLAVVIGGCKPRGDDLEVSSKSAGDSSVAVSADSAEKRDITLVRVIHAVPGAPAVDVSNGDVPAFTAVAFKSVTPYQGIRSNRPNFTLRPAGQATSEPLTDNRELIMDGEYYTVIAFPKDNSGAGVELQALRDDLTPASPTMARVRVVNAAARSTDVDVLVEGKAEPLFDDVGFKEEAGFKEVAPGTATLLVTAPDSKRVLLRIPGLEFKAGQSLTVVLTHPSAASTKLEAIKVVDELTRATGT